MIEHITQSIRFCLFVRPGKMRMLPFRGTLTIEHDLMNMEYPEVTLASNGITLWVDGVEKWLDKAVAFVAGERKFRVWNKDTYEWEDLGIKLPEFTGIEDLYSKLEEMIKKLAVPPEVDNGAAAGADCCK